MDSRLDVSASYPWGQACLNISRRTTRCELIDIEGITEYDRRMQGINMSGGATNAVEFCTTMFGLPTPVEWLESFTADLNITELETGGSNLLEVPVVPFAFQMATRPLLGLNDEAISDLVQGEQESEDEDEDEYV